MVYLNITVTNIYINELYNDLLKHVWYIILASVPALRAAAGACQIGTIIRKIHTRTPLKSL